MATTATATAATADPATLARLFADLDRALRQSLYEKANDVCASSTTARICTAPQSPHAYLTSSGLVWAEFTRSPPVRSTTPTPLYPAPVLKAQPDDPDATLTRIVVLIKLSNFEGALTQIGRQQVVSASQLAFETAYCQYRTSKLQLALGTLQGIPAPVPRRARLLTAQVVSVHGAAHAHRCPSLYPR